MLKIEVHGVFSDETRVRLHSFNGGIKVWRNKRESYFDNYVIYYQAYGGGLIIVWGSISATRRTELVMFGNATMNSVRYLSEVLQPVVLPFANEISHSFVFVDDTARPHIEQEKSMHMD